MKSSHVLSLAVVVVIAGFAAPLLVAKCISAFRASSPGARASAVAAHVAPAPVASRRTPSMKAPPAPQGKQIYALSCAPCHGADGLGDPSYSAPALAGQKDWYLVRQLEKFRDGTRGTHPQDLQGMQMAPVLRLLADEGAIQQVVEYIASMPPFEAAGTVAGDPTAGRALYVGTCLPCHGEQGDGNPLLKAPMLAGQADWYLVRQLTKFKEGIRGSAPGDSEGMQMMGMAKTLVDEQAMSDLAAYVNGLRKQKPAEPPAPAVAISQPHHAERVYALNCAPCHKPAGEGDPTFGAPALSGQMDWYLARQLRNFRDGARGTHGADMEGRQMAAILRVLPDDESIAELAAYLASLPPFDTHHTLEARLENGKALFTTTCLPCHGEHAEGNPLLQAPMLAGQADWYLARQIRKFKNGVRGAHPEDAAGLQMAAMAKTIVDDEAVLDLAAYINSLR